MNSAMSRVGKYWVQQRATGGQKRKGAKKDGGKEEGGEQHIKRGRGGGLVHEWFERHAFQEKRAVGGGKFGQGAQKKKNPPRI